MKLKLLTLTCAVGLFALGTGIKAADVPVAGCESECAKGAVKCKICGFEKKASSTASSKLSSTTSHKSSDTVSSGTSKTSPGTPSSKTEELSPVEAAALSAVGSAAKKDPETLCGKGKFLSTATTIRSFGGKLCKIPVFAAFARKKCEGIDGFSGSSCDNNIEGALKGKTPDEVLNNAAGNEKDKWHKLAVQLKAGL